MWSALHRIGEALGLVAPEPAIDVETINAILNAPDSDNSDEDETPAENLTEDGVVCQHRVGTVKLLFDNYGFISTDDGEGQIYFRRQDAPAELKAGDQVMYLVFRREAGDEWVVRKVMSVVNDSWDARVNEGDDSYSDMPEVRENCETAYKHVIAQVTGREGRNVLAANLRFSLDAVKIDFIPVEGDWIVLESLVQTEQSADTLLVVDRVIPLRTQVIDGSVTHYSPETRQGIIDGTVVFFQDACEPGYMPRVGDKVRVFSLESEQGTLTWRGLTVVPTSHRELETSLDPQQLADLLENKRGVLIADDTSFGVVNLAQEKQITIQVTNENETNVKLLDVEFSSQDSQFCLVQPSWNNVFEIPAKNSVEFIFSVTGRFVGRSSEVVKFQFEGFEIGRQLVVDVQSASVVSSLTEQRGKANQRSKPEPITAQKLLATRNGFVVPGRRPLKPANFVPVQLGMFVLPEKLIKIVLDGQPRRQNDVIARLSEHYSFLKEPLNEKNYVLRWDILIHMEELENAIQISRYNTNASFKRVQDYLSLEIPGLAERRPSLIIGDRVVARENWNEENNWSSGKKNLAFEGHIHKVLSNEILLKFDHNFHDSCYGVYSIAFEANRTSYRREHQAIHLAHKNLSAKWLFPSKVEYKHPQVVICEEEESSVLDEQNVENCKETNLRNSALADGDSNKRVSESDKIQTSSKIISDKLIKSNNENKVLSVDDLEKLEKGIDNILEAASNKLNRETGDCPKPKILKRSKSKVADMFDKKEDDVPQKTSPPRVSVADRLFQNGKSPPAEKSPKDVKNMLQQLANLSMSEKKPCANAEMKTLQEIEKSLLNGSNNVLDGIKPLEENSAFSKFLKSNNIDKPTSLVENDSKENQKKIQKNNINETKRKQKEDKINWNSNSELKEGREKVANIRNKNYNRRKVTWYNPRLNHYQKEAIRNILKGEARPLPYVIFGPPGTGKTITLVEAALQIYHCLPNSRLLIGTPSNSSADLVCERLLDSGLMQPGGLLRLVGFHYSDQGKISDRLKQYCGMADIKARDDYQDPQTNLEGVVNLSRHAIGRHRITVGTCNTLGVLYQMGFPRGHFTHVMLDEAGQATEPEILIPLAFLHESEGQAVLAGDPMQLGPVVLSKEADRLGLGESLLSRLLLTTPYRRDMTGYPTTSGYNPHLVTRLIYNYRSLPEILYLPNSMFYDNDLVPQVSEETSEEACLLRSLASGLPQREVGPPALVFHGVRGTNCQAPDSPSWHNPHEAVQATIYLQMLYTAGLSPDDCGIITPYQAQVTKIKQMLQTLEVPMPKVGSVEEFQGQERMVIILSTVRSSPRLIETDVRHTVGFVASPRRLNVAITRARALLIILGNPHLLARDQYWRSVLEYCVRIEAYTGCDRPNL